ncbi:MAG: hypothetical protein CMA53_02685 [Euryarchaeota archaeon]|nr:hypothetical protein [Euryarchaeota archaeon]
MLIYQTHQKAEVQNLQSLNWDNSDIMSYLAYLNKKQTLIETGRKHGKYSRDSDRSKVYKSEFKYERTYGTGKQFKNLAEAQKYCDHVLASKTWQKMSNNTHIALSTMYGNRTAGRAWRNNIDLNVKGGMNQYVLLHEMAHCAGNMHHDTQFRIDLLKLVSRFIGKEQAEYLKACFKEKKLKLKINTNIMKPDAWMKMNKRMEMARDKRLDMAA